MLRFRLSSPGAAPSCLATIEVTVYFQVLENALEVRCTESSHCVPSRLCREALTRAGFFTTLCATGTDIGESFVARLVQPTFRLASSY